MNSTIEKSHDGIKILVQWTVKKAEPLGGITWTGKASGHGEDGSEWESQVEGSFVGSLFIISEYFLVTELWNETIKQN